MIETDNAFLFSGSQDSLSSSHRTNMTFDGRVFESSDHCFVYQKALLFNDKATAERICSETNPIEINALGRRVKGFHESIWLGNRRRLMTLATIAKFSQNRTIANELLATGVKRLANANPKDRIWGIGLSASAPTATDPASWKGINLLGQILEDVRAQLRKFVIDMNAQHLPTVLNTSS